MNKIYILLVLIMVIIIISMLIALHKIDGVNKHNEKRYLNILLTQTNGVTANIGSINSMTCTSKQTEIEYTEHEKYDGLNIIQDKTLTIPNNKISRLEIRGE